MNLELPFLLLEQSVCLVYKYVCVCLYHVLFCLINEFIVKQLESAVCNTLKAAYTTCSSLNISEEKVCKLSQEEREFWLVAKFGLTQVNKLCRVMKSIPSTLTKKQKEDIATRLYGEECQSPILECCPHLIVQQETVDDHCILAPPTGSCYDCEHGLVSNHETKVSNLIVLSSLYFSHTYRSHAIQ